MAAAGLAVVGAALFAAGMMSEPWRGFSAGLMAAYYSISVAIGSAVVLALMHVTNAGWGTVIRRVPEAMTTWLPFGFVLLFAVTFFGMHDLYEWSHPDIVAKDALLQHKSVLLNAKGFFIRMAVILGAWTLLTWLMRRHSYAQDHDGDVKHTTANAKWATIFLIVFGLGITMGSLDWLMSLEPHWFSTMFGVYQFAGSHKTACAVILLTVLGLHKGGFLPQANANHFHDLGKMLFAFSVFWAYIWVSQYLLIWYSNIPEETGYYLLRWDHGWMALFAGNVVLNFLVPFFVLLPRPNKRNPKVLVPVAILMLLGHVLDVYLQVMPATAHFHAHHTGTVAHGPVFGLAEIGAFALVGGLFVLVVMTMLGKAALIPGKDPYLQESLHHHQ